jgi:hypothetical protein
VQLNDGALSWCSGQDSNLHYALIRRFTGISRGYSLLYDRSESAGVPCPSRTDLNWVAASRVTDPPTALAGARGIEPRLAGLEAAALPLRHTPVLLVFRLSKSKKKARRFGRAFSNPDCAWTLPAAFPPWIGRHDDATGLPMGAHEYAARFIEPLASCFGFWESQHSKPFIHRGW